tara:strand:- start:6206 stop:6370 length:165 start_codon:yes stop_codon:yes gene_type:complete
MSRVERYYCVSKSLENRTVSTEEQVVKFLNNVKSASDIPDFELVQLKRLGNESL